MGTRHLYWILTGPSFAVQAGGLISASLRPGVTKRCRLSWLTSDHSAYEPKGGGGFAGSQESEI
jgi:hypothetical protein